MSELPALSVTRKLVNLGQPDMDRFQQAWQIGFTGSHGLRDNFELVDDVREEHVLFGAGQMFSMFQDMRKPITEDAVIELQQHLGEVLPDCFDDPVTVPTFPVSIDMMGQHYNIVKIGQSERLVDERDMVLQAIHDFYGTAKTAAGSSKYTRRAKIPVAKFGYRTVEQQKVLARIVRDTMKRIKPVFPERIEYDAVDINLETFSNRPRNEQ